MQSLARLYAKFRGTVCKGYAEVMQRLVEG
jgi:hypothetical protein